MISTSATSNSTALTLLLSYKQRDEATDAIGALAFSASSDSVHKAILDALVENHDLREQFKENFEAIKKDKRHLSRQEARHEALIEVILKNRESFPPEEFSISADLPGGASVTTTIPSTVSMKGQIFKQWVADKSDAYAAELEARQQAENNDPQANAASQIVKFMVLDNEKLALTLFEDGAADEEELAEPFLADKPREKDEDALWAADTETPSSAKG